MPDLEVKILKTSNNWLDIKNAALNTVGKESEIYPTSEWKRKILLSEHSPIRKLIISWKWTNLKYWVSVHLVRHKFGIEHFVKSQRPDRYIKSPNRDNEPQSALINHECEANAQAIINISRKRLCNMAMPETRKAWEMFLDTLSPIEPELRSVCVKECVYRGVCYEYKGCGYDKTEKFQEELKEYRG